MHGLIDLKLSIIFSEVPKRFLQSNGGILAAPALSLIKFTDARGEITRDCAIRTGPRVALQAGEVARLEFDVVHRKPILLVVDLGSGIGSGIRSGMGSGIRSGMGLCSHFY
jgi:hypothetical protein